MAPRGMAVRRLHCYRTGNRPLRKFAMTTVPTSDVPFEYSGTDNLEVMLEAENYNRFLVDEVVRHYPGQGRVLDFGAGVGTFSTMVRDRGLDVACLEPDAAQRARLTGQGFAAYADPAEVPPASLSYVFSLNVLEHIPDDLAAARAIAGMLEPGGMAYVYVPAFPLLFGPMDRKVGHVRRYRAAGLQALFREAGLDVIDGGYADSLGFLATLAFNALPSRDGGLSSGPVRAYDRLVFPLSRLGDRVVSRLFGKNAWLIARRPAEA